MCFLLLLFLYEAIGKITVHLIIEELTLPLWVLLLIEELMCIDHRVGQLVFTVAPSQMGDRPFKMCCQGFGHPVYHKASDLALIA